MCFAHGAVTWKLTDVIYKGLIVAAVGLGGWDMLGAVVIEVVPGVCWSQQGPAKLLPVSREAPVKIP